MDARCQASALLPATAQARAVAAAALREHAAWGAPTIDAHGRLTQAGASEGADNRPTPFAEAPWQRVVRYWQAVGMAGGEMPEQVRFGALQPAQRSLLEQALAQASDSRLAGLGLGPNQGLNSQDAQALQVALARVAVIDTAWSAAFVSWLAREAGLQRTAFHFSQAHADYAAAAWAATQADAAGTATAQALRACALAHTPARVGDLVCHARGRSAGLNDYAALTQALQQRLDFGRALPMHCDVVTQVDAQGLSAVGGNVLDAVTLRRLDFAPGTRQLDTSYLPQACTPEAVAALSCVNRHMSRQPWSLLLQWR